MNRFPVIFHGSRKNRQIALTFDDGPNPYATPHILQILQRFKVKASFFPIAHWVERHPGIAQQILADGHMVGNHTYSHRPDSFDFDAAEPVLRQVLGIQPNCARPPYMRLNLSASEENQLQNYSVVCSDVDSLDYTWIPCDRIVEQVLAKTRPGSIIVFHDGSECEDELPSRPKEMLRALADIITELQNNYEFVRIDNLCL